MTTKQTSNFLNFLLKFLKQNLHKRSKRIVLAFDKLRRIVLASLVAFLFVPVVGYAQGPLPPSQTPPINPTPTNSSTCDLTRLSDANAKADYVFAPSENTPINPEQVFQIGVKISNITDQQLAAACYQSQNLKISAKFYLYQCLPLLDYIACSQATGPALSEGILEGTGKVIKDSSGTAIGIGGVFAPMKLTDIMKTRITGAPFDFSITNTILNNYYVYVYPEVLISDMNKVEVPFNDTYAFWRQVTVSAPVGSPGAVPPEFAPETENTANPGAAGTLFNFIRSVIAYIVLLLTSFIYYIFSIILVPVLVALLQIQAYKDNFVNFIYPGWVIIRNISNILFIIALLWIGLRTLFQVDDASKSRSFIVRLILMALLVNFSLVIGQAIVGIADTVQAQFLPKDSRVVEALGHKLMVDPIITFRGGADLDASGNFTSNSFASDLPKAIILLVLAVAAFFAFVALIAFIFVRLGMLWLLYMLSPLAYVAQILPETKEYGKKWFTEFLRYAFVVPILAFFLNMTALIAVTFSRTSGDQVQVEGSGTTALGGLVPTGDAAAGIVEFAVTVMSHFIVLVFLFGGMAFAQKFGGVGSKQIVSFAKKGFDAVTKRPAMWAARGAGNLAKSYGKEQYERKIAGGLLDPKAWKEGWKGRISTETNTQKSNRLLKKDGKLNPGIATQYMGTSLKYLFHKMTFGAPHRLLSEADRLKEQASIFTENERLAKEVKLGENQSVKQIYDAFKTGIPETGPINVAGLLGSLGTQITDFENQGNLKADNLEIEANTLEANGNMSGAAAKRAEAASVLQEYEDKVKELNKVKDKLDPATNGGVDVNSDPGLRKQISNDLEKSIEELAKNIEDSQKQIKDNNVLKQKYGVTGDLPESERERLRKQAESLEQKASERKLPESLAIRALLREGQKKEMEKYDGVDDPDELIAIHKKAMKDNNLLLATAIQKKLAKEGFFKDLLQSEGGRNNIESMQAFFAKNLKGMAPNVRMQVMSEVSYLNKQSNNLALSNATKMDAETGSLRLATLEEQAKKVNGFLESRNPNDLSNLKADQVVREREDGKNEIFGGYVNAMKKHMESLSAIEFDKYVPKIPTNVAKKVANATNFGDFNPQGTAIGNKIQQAFKDRGK